MIGSERTSFIVAGDRCAAWVTLPEGAEPHPVVVLVHGGGATHSMMLDKYESAFAAAGIATVAFDFRHYGESEGQPRQLLSMRKHVEDVEGALAFIRTRSELDHRRIALWGTSLGATHVVSVAARHPELAAAIVQCPILVGRAPAFASGPLAMLRLTIPMVSDFFRGLLGMRRHYVQIAGRPGAVAFVDVPGALEGWHSVVPPGIAFDGRVTASSGLGVILSNAAAKARDVNCPLLLCICDNENLMDPKIAVDAAKRAPKGVAIHYPSDHFQIYHSPIFECAIADQIEFLSEHLGLQRATS